SKECPSCMYIIAAGHKVCPNCGYEFPAAETEYELRDDDIMGDDGMALNVQYWTWETKTSKSSNPMVVVSYYGSYSDPVLREYLLIWADGFAGKKGRVNLNEICKGCGVDYSNFDNITDFIDTMVNELPPEVIRYEKDGKYNRVIAREWSDDGDL
ncbi:MAG TPA: hypothetical protein VKP88_07195, partial [Candidatus Paceibacterota bacterium]|nr:hypothetical protein [Candidatus Paceibacterota bacterium]